MWFRKQSMGQQGYEQNILLLPYEYKERPKQRSQSRNGRREREGRKGKRECYRRPSGGGVYRTKVFRSCVDYVCCLGQLFAGEETALRAPNPIPIPIPVRVHISVLDSSQREGTKKFILPGGSIRGASSLTGRWVCCCRGSFWFRSSGGICAGCARGFLRDLFF
jgi:hypothetical protein